MNAMASAELSVPALQETPISETSDTHLKLYVQDPEIDTATEEVTDKIRILIPDLGSTKSGAHFAMDVKRDDGKLTFEYLTSWDGETWNVKHTDTIDVPDDADATTIIDNRRKRYDDCINWDATGI